MESDKDIFKIGANDDTKIELFDLNINEKIASTSVSDCNSSDDVICASLLSVSLPLYAEDAISWSLDDDICILSREGFEFDDSDEEYKECDLLYHMLEDKLAGLRRQLAELAELNREKCCDEHVSTFQCTSAVSILSTGPFKMAEKPDSPPPTKTTSTPLSPFAKEFVPRRLPDQRQHEELLPIIKMMTNLASQPAIFDQYKAVCLAKLNNLKNDEKILKYAINLIFTSSVMHPNLRYNGARLCSYLSQNSDATFQRLLKEQCREDFDKCESMLTDSALQFRGLVYFFGELFVCSSGYVEAEDVCHLLSLLLDVPTDENLKCVGDVLKLTGVFMTDKFGLFIEDNCFERVLRKLKKVLSDGDNNIDVHRRAILVSVLESRARNWQSGIKEDVINSANYERQKKEELDFTHLYLDDPIKDDGGMTEEMKSCFNAYIGKKKISNMNTHSIIAVQFFV
uniref:MIF4G domain-containing protein n=1 Tax=Strigamia maritima TaxID=126957 RepID=T1J8W3_STRMM